MNNALPKVTAGLSQASQILLKGLPTTVTSGDLRRAVLLAGLTGVTDVTLLYKRFSPSGQALLTMAAPDFTRDALRLAKKITFMGCEEIYASTTTDIQFSWEKRFRGVKGRADALNRGLLGSGPSAGFPPGRTVSIVGIPGRATVQSFRPLVEGFQLADDEENSVMQVPLPEDKFSMFGRFVVVLASESEANRLVRKLHLTRFRPQTSQCMMASILY